MSNNQIGDSVPVGAVFAFAGNNTALQKLDGWLPCDGRDLKIAAHVELYTAIGNANGGDGSTSFKLPNYQGYFLRGVSQGSGNDPDAGSRTAPASLANSGDNPGSIQGWNTAVPASGAFKLDIDHLPSKSQKVNVGSLAGSNVAKWNSNSTTVDMKTGGDKETRPKNKYVNFIIKSSTKTSKGTAVTIPAGAVIPFAGINIAALGNQWLMCNGNKLNSGSYKALYTAIGVIHGGSGQPYFYLPDYQGYFLRGVSGLSLNDPDAGERTPPQPTLPVGQQGVTGNNVGSVQSWATAQGSNQFSLSVPNLPTKRKEVDNIAGRKNSAATMKVQELASPSSGGDNESRPVNAYVDWYIRAF
jgi:microcystin-dependent protein